MARDARKVADAVAVRVSEAARVDLVKDAFTPPGGGIGMFGGRRVGHAPRVPCGPRCGPGRRAPGRLAPVPSRPRPRRQSDSWPPAASRPVPVPATATTPKRWLARRGCTWDRFGPAEGEIWRGFTCRVPGTPESAGAPEFRSHVHAVRKLRHRAPRAPRAMDEPQRRPGGASPLSPRPPRPQRVPAAERSPRRASRGTARRHRPASPAR